MQAKLLVGTAKGLVTFSQSGSGWTLTSVQFEGLAISMIYEDDRTGTWWAAISHRHWGEKLHWSMNAGETWTEVDTPGYAGYFVSPGKPAALKKIWCMQHAGTAQPGGLWVGTEPGGLFYSADGGKNFKLNESLWNHPSRMDANQWFGAGKDFPFIHSIVVDPANANHVYVGVSCAGIFETHNGGKTWTAKNNGLIAAYLPNPKTAIGHDPHRMLLCPAHPEVLWQQNHCGIFRSTDGGAHWVDVSGKEGFPKYGFALAVDEKDPGKAWVIPAVSDEKRIPVDLRLTVCKTTDGGELWTSCSKGLPSSNSFDVVLRHSLVKKNNVMAFGTNNGNVYFSPDEGESWETISNNLAMVNGMLLV